MHLSPCHLRNTGVLAAHSRTWVSRGRQGYKSRSLCSLPLHIKPRAHWAISRQSVLEHKFLNSGSRKKKSQEEFLKEKKRDFHIHLQNTKTKLQFLKKSVGRLASSKKDRIINTPSTVWMDFMNLRLSVVAVGSHSPKVEDSAFAY